MCLAMCGNLQMLCALTVTTKRKKFMSVKKCRIKQNQLEFVLPDAQLANTLEIRPYSEQTWKGLLCEDQGESGGMTGPKGNKISISLCLALSRA